MRFAPGKNSHIINFVFLFGYLSAAHIYRQIVDYGGYTMDITLYVLLLKMFHKTIAILFYLDL